MLDLTNKNNQVQWRHKCHVVKRHLYMEEGGRGGGAGAANCGYKVCTSHDGQLGGTRFRHTGRRDRTDPPPLPPRPVLFPPSFFAAYAGK
jgi:hypothetical protein